MLPRLLLLSPDLTSIGDIRDLEDACIRTVASILPFTPYFGDQTFSSISITCNREKLKKLKIFITYKLFEVFDDIYCE